MTTDPDSQSTIRYKEFYNAGRNMAEPQWGRKPTLDDLQCPTCGSHDMYYSAPPDSPSEVNMDTVRCKNCGRITDWYEAFMQRKTHLLEMPLLVIKPEIEQKGG